MRPGWSVLAILTLGACSSNWEPANPIDTSVSMRPFFLDEDGDGWGSFGSEGMMLEQGDETTGFTARNNRDCDDADANVSGLTGSICPDRLVDTETAYAAVIQGEKEFVLVHAASETVWPGYAEDACSPWGWGGGLAEFSTADELTAVKNALGDQSTYAGWIGLVPDGDGWIWESGATLDLNAIKVDFCGSMPDPATMDPARQRVALVKTSATNFCLGTPDQAETAGYSEGYAHFVCSRAKPVAETYALDDLPGAE